MTDELARSSLNGAPAPTFGEEIAALERKVFSTADTDVRAILSGILKAGEKTLIEMSTLKNRLEAAEKATIDATETAVKKIKRSNLVAAAKAAGAVDATEALQFIKLAEVTVSETGETNAADLVAGLKASKPHLFGRSSSSAAAASPAAGDNTRKSVLAMTKEEYAAAKAAVIRR